MNIDRLVEMANDVGNFFLAEASEAEQIEGVRDHLQKFWDPRMRQQIRAYAEGSGKALLPHVRSAVRLLK